MRAIHRAAAELTLERGFDEFTMDDLAAVVGVSRRTLFNYVGDKVSAVLGPNDPGDAECMKTALRDQDPATPLLTRGIAAMADGFRNAQLTGDDLDLVRLITRAAAHEPKVAHALYERVRGAVEQLTDIAAEIEGWGPHDRRSRVFGRTLVMIVEEALHATADAYANGRTDYTIDAALAEYETALRQL